MAQAAYMNGHLRSAQSRKRHVQTLTREREQSRKRAAEAADDARLGQAARNRRALREQALAERGKLRRRSHPVRLVMICSALFFTGLGGLYLVDLGADGG